VFAIKPTHGNYKRRTRQGLLLSRTPLDDYAEEKLKSDHLPPLEMTPAVRLSLFALRA
jgi:hypothetical protein